MNNKGKYIGINQRIPFEVLDSAIYSYLESGKINKEFILQRMFEFTSGINRANKASNYIVQILTRQQHILDNFKLSNKIVSYSSFGIEERKCISLCLICLTYPITYNLLIALSQGFKVQSQINKKFINEKVMSIYGSNRTVDIAIDALLPMLIELNTIKRDKMSIYSLGDKLIATNNFIQELIVYTDIKITGSKNILFEELEYKPWFLYFNAINLLPENFKWLLKRKDSSVGKGYITL
jgi:hypothetical protein